MRMPKWSVALSCLGGAVLLLAAVTPAHADVTTEKGSSILIFPKVRAGGAFDTTIQIANTGNSMVHAKCYYVNALGLDGTVDGETWNEIDFDIWLTKQQPTHWSVTHGRNVVPDCTFGEDCSGFPPGLVPPMPDFEGELKCIEVTESGEPITGNHLKGEATIETVAEVMVTGTGDISKYNAVGIRGNPDAVPTNPLQLDDETYDACPEVTYVNLFADGAPDPGIRQVENARSSSELTLVPCSQDFELQEPDEVTLQFLIYNEFEERFSTSTTVRCYFNELLTDIDSPNDPSRSVFSEDVLGTTVALAIITPVVGEDGDSGGVIGILERAIRLAGEQSRAATNLPTQGSFIPPSGADAIRLTEGF